jgi:hypothetical protein
MQAGQLFVRAARCAKRMDRSLPEFVRRKTAAREEPLRTGFLRLMGWLEGDRSEVPYGEPNIETAAIRMRS